MRSKLMLSVSLVFMLCLTHPVCAVTNVFEYPLVFPRHQQLAFAFQQGMRKKNFSEMERICRTGTALLPENPVWRYNLACTLALQNQPAEALQALDEAISLGFRDEAMIAADEDLARLRQLPTFQGLLARARNLRGKPVEGQPVARVAQVSDGVAHVSASNTIWDLERGHFRSFFALPPRAPAPAEVAPRWSGPAAAVIRPWLLAGTAAGNRGDFYDNRDDGHSLLDRTPFAGLTVVQYDADARQYGAHYGLSQFLYNGVVIGNSSVAVTGGPFWRSVPRGALCDGSAVAFLFVQYLSNHLYCYPSHRDHDAAGLGDLYPANQPYVLISQGSSGSDQAFLQAFVATLAAFRPETKQFLIARGLVAPTLQMLLRASRKTVGKPENYLDGAAHPTVFDATTLDVERMVRMAHDLTTNDIPPVVSLRTLAEVHPVPGVDFFDAATAEVLYDSPCVISRVLRSTARRHTMTLGAQLTGVPADGWRIHWVVLRGDPRKVTILPFKPDQSQVELSVAHHGGTFPVRAGQPLQTSRVDIGVIASNGRQYSAPSFVSFFHLNNEIRSYADDGRILTVDYAAAVVTNRYVDPVLSMDKHWRDEYLYDEARQPTGWLRRTGDTVERFSMRGERVLETDKQGRPTVTRTVNYIPRSSVDNAMVPDLIQVDGEERIRYRYASERDLTGEVVSRERAVP
ncbi:MAG: tetratricopeptide repeat protein [Kiritimatiellia bacterium]